MAFSIIVSPYGVAEDSLPAGTHFFGDHVRFGPLDDQHKLRIVDYLDALGEELLSKRVRQRPAFVISSDNIPFLKNSSPDAERLDTSLHLHRFCLEYFSSSKAPMAAFGFDGTEISARVLDFRELLSTEANTLDAGSWEKSAAYLNFAYDALSKAPLGPLAITRICRAYRHGASSDGIIDLAIGLECLIPADTEISYQFALFHALINRDPADERKDTFDILRTLYQLRSQIVHGGIAKPSDKKKMPVIKDRWDDLLGIARANLTYYLMYCKGSDAKGWGDHLRALALGSPRISSEAA